MWLKEMQCPNLQRRRGKGFGSRIAGWLYEGLPTVLQLMSDKPDLNGTVSINCFLS